jgi:hypothetical protein
MEPAKRQANSRGKPNAVYSSRVLQSALLSVYSWWMIFTSQ